VGARTALVAYNLWLGDGDQAVARSIATSIRGPAVRALGIDAGGTAQVSCNLIDPDTVGPAEVYDTVAMLASKHGTAIARAELVGLAPARVLDATPRSRWRELGLDPTQTVERRLEVAVKKRTTSLKAPPSGRR
jgi:glutamate formiminotransferase